VNTSSSARITRRSAARPVLAACLGLTFVLASCGGGDDPVPAPADADEVDTSATTAAPATTDTGSTPDATSEAAPVEGPVSTLSPEIPPAYLEGVSPVDVIGDPLPMFPEGGNDPAIGMAAPTLVGYDLDGNPIRVDPSTDGPMMLVFLAHWCSHCNAEVPRLNELRDAGRFPDDLEIVAIATGSRPDQPNWPPTSWLEDTMDWTYPALLDGFDMDLQTYIAYNAYGIAGFPMIVLIDGDGNVAYRWSGERGADEVMSLIDEHLALS